MIRLQFSSGTIRLMTQFQRKALVLEDPSLILICRGGVVMVSPVIHMRRTAVQDSELNGQRIAEDEKLVLWYGVIVTLRFSPTQTNLMLVEIMRKNI